jgi:RimJ/RimL family protein N-acetyltransferase
MAHTVSAGVIQTARLDLVPLALPIAAAIVAGVRPPGVRWALGYPTDGTLIGAGLIVTAHNKGHDLGPFGTYQVIYRDRDVIVGDCGFEGPPNSEGEIRIAVGTAISQRRRGYAREAAQGLIRWALERDDIVRVIADTARTNAPSIGVMETAGMRRYRADESLVYYEA